MIGMAAEENAFVGSATAAATDGKASLMDLLDEYWFFHNPLNGRRPPPRTLPKPPCTPTTAKEEAGAAEIAHKLLRAPSTPSHRAPRKESNARRSRRRFIQGRRKWRSHSEMEAFEIQGFRDLGFVFLEEAPGARLADVVRCLRDKRPISGDGRGGRAYLSEAWLVERAAPPKLAWEERRSAADVQEQLRLWARAVARNVRLM
ncbi:hypothetical protein OPV22_026998 [Ensete ventricosum]|uniref:Uncharacterized protein n=1 Tax=Ensete ventricosum TaxID=4639 RepID=A0AAV8P3S4_ENSVE|nr:hypothetical protein OPV22_026998 [Ensete ventricosum]